MSRLLVFGGTTESRTLLERGIPALCCVATDYGAKLLEGLDNVTPLVGRLDAPAMEALFRREGITHVIDATHPYAVEVSRNIRAACAAAGIKLLRVARPRTPLPESAVAHHAHHLDRHAHGLVVQQSLFIVFFMLISPLLRA